MSAMSQAHADAHDTGVPESESVVAVNGLRRIAHLLTGARVTTNAMVDMADEDELISCVEAAVVEMIVERGAGEQHRAFLRSEVRELRLQLERTGEALDRAKSAATASEGRKAESIANLTFQHAQSVRQMRAELIDALEQIQNVTTTPERAARLTELKEWAAKTERQKATQADVGT